MAILIDIPPLSADEAHALLATSSEHTTTGLRNRALVVLLWRVGLRPGEALTVRAADVDGETGVITLPSRQAGIDRLAARVIAAWAHRRTELGLNSDGPFISTLAGNPLSQAYVRELLPRLAERAGLTVRVHAMGLRYACAAEMGQEGLLTEVIQAQLGVEPQSAIGRYLPRADLAEMVRAMQARPIPA